MAAITSANLAKHVRADYGELEDPTGALQARVENIVLKRQAHFVKHAIDAAAADVTAEHTFFVADRSYQITSVTFLPSTAVTAGATHFATLLVAKCPLAAPGTRPNVATRSLAATNMVAFTRESMTLTATAADLLLITGDGLTFAITKTMNGLAVPAGTVTVNMVEV